MPKSLFDADVTSRAKGQIFGLSLHLHPYLLYLRSKGSGKSGHLHRLPEPSLLENTIRTKITCVCSSTFKLDIICINLAVSIYNIIFTFWKQVFNES